MYQPNVPVGRRSGNFRGVKMALMVFQIIGIIGSVLAIILAAVVLGAADTQTNVDRDELRRDATIVLVAGIISLLVYVIGLLGAVKENWILTLVFGVIIMISSILNIVGGSYWTFAIGVIVAVLAFVFVHLVRKEVIGNPA